MSDTRSSLLEDARSFFALVSAHARRAARQSATRPDAVPVLLIPGLMAGDWTMSMLAGELERSGHPTVRAGIGINVGCTREMVTRLEERLIAASTTFGRRVAVVGWSRGGALGKLVAMRRPEAVSALIALASPNVDPLAVSPKVERQVRVLTWMHAMGASGVMSDDCVRGQCAHDMFSALSAPFPATIPYTAFYSRRDTIVDWRACCDPAAELVEVSASHLSIATNPVVIATMKARLAGVVSRAA